MNKTSLIESIVKKISKNLLHEAVTDRAVNDISRFIVNQFKKREPAIEYFIFERAEEEITIQVNLMLEEVEDFNHPFSIDASSEWDEIDILIEYREDAFPRHMTELVAEIKETIEHEMVHVLQTFFEDESVQYDRHETNLEYLISKQEIPAYVKGLVKRARHKKITLDDAMEEWFSENVLKFDNPKEDWEKVKTVWMDYANDMRQKNKIKKFN